MKFKNILPFGLLAIVSLASCVSEEFKGSKESAEKGLMALGVSLRNPEATRAKSQVSDFPVVVYDAEGKVVKSYNTVDDVPATEVLNVGTYTVESHTPGVLQKKMTAPYYDGTETMEILKNTTTDVEVVCTIQNSRIEVAYDPEFMSVFTDWSITLDDGTEGAVTALAFTKTDGASPAPIYWYFENEVERLTVNFRGTTKDGNIVSATNFISKDQANEHYDDDHQYFSGGDAIVLNFKPAEANTGEVTTITINATVTFEEHTDDLIVEITDDINIDDPDEPQDPPVTGDDAITLSLPAPISFPFLGAATVDKSLGDTEIKAENGLKSIIVKIESTSEDMISSVGKLNTDYGVDFIGGAEIVGNQQVVTLFNDLNQPLSVPAEGDKEYVFPIGNFFQLLQVLVGTHTFNLTVTDMNGNIKTGKVTITITA